MLSKIVNLSVKNYCKTPLRNASSTVASRQLTSYRKSLVLISGLGSLSCYDYFIRDGETLGAIVRFARSFKIALQISIDYNIGLHGLDEESEEYDKVSLRSLI